MTAHIPNPDDPVSREAARAIAHLNADHADALLDMARALAGCPEALAARCLDADRTALTLEATTPTDTLTLRIPTTSRFPTPRPPQGDREARPSSPRSPERAVGNRPENPASPDKRQDTLTSPFIRHILIEQMIGKRTKRGNSFLAPLLRGACVAQKEPLAIEQVALGGPDGEVESVDAIISGRTGVLKPIEQKPSLMLGILRGPLAAPDTRRGNSDSRTARKPSSH
jgi:hypothetical protein